MISSSVASATVIVVETRVWIDVLNGVDSPRALQAVALMEGGEPVALTDVVMTEVLQGLRSAREAQLVERLLRDFPVLRLQGLDDFVPAVELHRTARGKGMTIRRTVDCLIAAPCVHTGAPILHADPDLDRLASCTPLRVYP